MNEGSRVFTPGNRTLGRMLQDALDDICKPRAGEQERKDGWSGEGNLVPDSRAN